MLRPRYISLGQQGSSVLTKITEISRNFPACFTTASMLRSLDEVIADGNALKNQAVQNAPVVSFSKTSGDIQDSVKRAETLKDSLSKYPPNTLICNNNPATKALHWQTVQTITGVYQAAYGVDGAYLTLNAAWEEFKEDVNPFNHIPPLIPGLPTAGWVQWLLVGVAALVVYMSVKKSPIVVVQPKTESK